MAVIPAGPGYQLTILLASSLYYSVLGDRLDILLLILTSILQNRRTITDNVTHYIRPANVRLSAAIFVTGLIGSQVLRWLRGTDEPRWTGPGKPLLLPCRTTHSRVFPKKHSFSYSYLVVGIPVGWEGSAGGLVSTGVKGPSNFSSWFLSASPTKGWYNIDADDYLERGSSHLGLRGKLNAYLESQGVDPAVYPHAYLVTAARFLGYHFNPVSFWYLYGADKALAAMILEVNNTFDERRMYFLTPDLTLQVETGNQSQSNVDTTESQSKTATPPGTTFSQTWPKDFHVSPFNSRKGTYSLSATDPLSSSALGTRPVNNTIVLKSSKAHGKLVARLFSDGIALDPASLSVWQKLKFLASWSWVGFVTFPRIVKEAGVLFFKRKLHVWFRPEPLKDSVGRNADKTESQLETVFRRYLRHIIEQSGAAITVKYIPSGVSNASKELMLSSGAKNGSEDIQELEFKILTPVFYTRFVYYAHDLEGLFCELRENGTIWISRPDLLPKFILRKPTPRQHVSNPIDFVYFKAIQYFRRRPERIERPMTWTTASTPGTSAKPSVTDIREFRISSMDGYVLAHESRKMRNIYRHSVLKLFIADRLVFGMVPLLEVQCLMVRGCLAWMSMRTISSVIPKLVLYLQEQFAV